ncbi:MAG: DNA translocase FtsK [Clostridia bacterium]
MANTVQKKQPAKRAGGTSKGRVQKEQPQEERGIWREALGVILFFAGILLFYFLIVEPKEGAGQAIVWFARALAGSLCYALPLVLGWMGVLVAFSGRDKSLKFGRIFLMALMILLVMTLIHLFSADDVMRGAQLFNYPNFLKRSYEFQKAGAGLLGALLCWPLYRGLGIAAAAMVLVALILADLILLRKISLRHIGHVAQERIGSMREEHEARAISRMEAREAACAVVPKAAPREGEMDDPFAKYLGDDAPGHRRQKEMRVEKISANDPLPGEPLVERMADAAFTDDVPGFLSGRKKGRARAEKITIHEPRPLGNAMTEPVMPEPDGSEVAEQPPRMRGAQAEVVVPEGDWRVVPLFKGRGAQADAPREFMQDDVDFGEIEPGGYGTDGGAGYGAGYDDCADDADDDADDDGADYGADYAKAGAPDVPRANQMQKAHGPGPDDAELVGEVDLATPPFDMPEAPFAMPITPEKHKMPAYQAPGGKRPPIAKPAPPEEFPYVYPPIDLLEASKPAKLHGQNESDLAKGKKLIETLSSFNIAARMIGIAHGPTVTRFELAPAAGVKVSRITALSDDIALNLAAVNVRIEAPIPGKAAVGVEVPNEQIETVPLRDVLESAECRRHPSRVAVALGRDNAGRYVIADLAKMPHVLIAGQTGSGKSVCINCIICSILYRATPGEVRLIMIDPKVVELSCYNGIPHLLVPVVTDPKKAASALAWAVVEMGNRYKKFATLGVRDMKGYNQHRPDDEPAMPQIVIIIDELADLMMVTPGEVEDAICRLAQLARAAGIHLVIATQRPSVNVITGVIKANIPSRIAFTVASQVDSRTILDGSGAEKLLGRGDMLYAPSGTAKVRVQGAWVSDDEVHDIVEYIKVRHEASYDEDMIEHIDASEMSDADREDSLGAFDDLLPQAVELVIDAEQASVSMLQRRLRVGHSRAGRLVDEMEVRGIVGPDEGSKSRKVLITREQYRAMFKE